MRHWLIVALFLIFSLLTGCEKFNFLKPQKTTARQEPASVQPQIQIKGTVIAKVNNSPITLEELNKYVDIFNKSLDFREDLTPEQKKENKIDTRDKKIKYLQDVLLRQKVFYQAALDRGLDRKEDIQELMEKNKIAILASAMQEEVIKSIDVSDATVEAAYRENIAYFKEPEVRSIREIVTKTEEEAKSVLIELYQGGDFVALAKSRSISDSAKAGGDLGELKRGARGEKFLAFDDMAFSSTLQKGSIAGPFKGPDGYYIIKIEALKEGKQYQLLEVKDDIKALLLIRDREKKLEKFYNDIKNTMKIDMAGMGEIK